MSSPEAIMQALRSEMRAAGVTYKQLAQRLGMSESSIKRVFSNGDMNLSRLAQICKAVGVAMEDVLRQATETLPHADTLTLAQERSLVEDPELLLVAICCLGHWTLAQIIDTYRLQLDQRQPVQQFVRAHVVDDYFGGRFDGDGETLLCVHGRLSDPSAQELVQKIRQLAAELARLHQDDQRLRPSERDGYTLLLGFRSWEFAPFTAMRRPGA